MQSTISSAIANTATASANTGKLSASTLIETIRITATTPIRNRIGNRTARLLMSSHLPYARSKKKRERDAGDFAISFGL